METAQQEVAARGETPIQLRAALSLAEVAGPSREFEAEEAAENPDTERFGVIATIYVTFTPLGQPPGSLEQRG